jgi:hypothetical protein
MANPEHIERLKQGIESWNAWRNENPEEPDLSLANLNGASLRLADLFGTDLSRANLHQADLTRAYLRGANLHGADLSDAKLGGADLIGANLLGADLRGADLSDAQLGGVSADLSYTNLSGALLWDTVITHVDLRMTKGLTEIVHRGPSLVSLDSVDLPQDGSALHFLRGAGIPDEWIDFWRTTMMHPIQYHSLFISYSSKDETLARRLHADLQDHGVRCWFAPHDMRPGTVIRKEIDKAIHLQDKVLLLLSEDAIGSGWVDYEVELALAREREQQREILFPVRLDEVVMQSVTGWAATLRRTRHIGDFTNWADSQAYQVAFDRLLRDLKQN